MGEKCFRAGDVRVNENPGLTSLQTIWMRQHNKVARTLQQLNPLWDDERLFQEARRIVAAQVQIVVYGEFLPSVLGLELMAHYHLLPLAYGFTNYDPWTDATMSNDFAAGAYRFGHSQVNTRFKFENTSVKEEFFALEDFYFFPFDLYKRGLDPILLGLIHQSSDEVDRHVTSAETEHLYRARTEPFGLDLVAIDIQRGRDHGLPAYVDYVEYCGGPNIMTFDDMRALIPDNVVDIYEQLYENARDVDLFTAGLTEFHVAGAVVGPTFACILGQMFHSLKFGDRFYYEHGNEAGSFTRAQLQELRKTTFAQIICDNSNVIRRIQANVFQQVSTHNPTRYCGQLPRTRLTPWREGQHG
ncbi:peroxidase-like [Ornithodoros turicata]|uniref:peroxidase-like n=1 Tax=Ornithodoros turicata TaxID=34597 RepID=UPI003139CB83